MRRPSASRFPLPLIAPLLLAVVSLCADRVPAVALAADKAPGATPADKADKPAPPADEAARRARNRSEFLVALGLWCSIVAVGLLLLVVVVTWGRSLRSLMRHKPKPPTAPDPLWYLKTKPQAPPAPAASAPGETGRRPDDGEPGTDVSSRTPL
jgi:hypothetical protein